MIHHVRRGCIRPSTRQPVVRRFMIVFVVLPSCCSCISIHWRDANGGTHHLGLFGYGIEEMAHGQRLRRVAVGLDVRLDGPDAGLTIGITDSELVRPEVRSAGPDTLASDFLAVRCEPRGRDSPRRIRCGLFYLREDVTADATLVDTTSVGFGFLPGGPTGCIHLGYSNWCQLTGDALGEDVVHYIPAGDLSHGAILWRFNSGGRTLLDAESGRQ